MAKKLLKATAVQMPKRKKLTGDKKTPVKPTKQQIQEMNDSKSNARKLAMPMGTMANMMREKVVKINQSSQVKLLPKLTKSALGKMKEEDLVVLANRMGIDASVDDLKSDTVVKVLKQIE